MQAALNNKGILKLWKKGGKQDFLNVISDYESNSVLPMPSAAVGSSTELWAS